MSETELNQANGSPENPGNGASAGKTYSQSELDALFSERAKQAESSLLKKLGFESSDQAKDFLSKARKGEEAQKSELQRSIEAQAKLESDLKAAVEANKRQSAQYEIAIHAQKLGVVDSDAAYRLLDQSKLKYSEDGKVENAEEALKALVSEKPFLLGGGTSAANPGKGEQESPFFAAMKKAAGLKS